MTTIALPMLRRPADLLEQARSQVWNALPMLRRPADLLEQEEEKMPHEKLIEKDKTYLVRKGLFHVQNEVGLGKSEEVYHQALKRWLSKNEIPYESKPPHTLFVGKDPVHTLYPDFVLWDKLVLELKSRPRRFVDKDWVQITNYLKFRNEKLGLLVNMGLQQVVVERVLWPNPDSKLEENWKAWQDASSQTLPHIRAAFLQHFADHQTGYGAEINQKLFLHRLRNKNLSVCCNPIVDCSYDGTHIGKSSLDTWIVEEEVVICQTSLFNDNDFNRLRTRSFMKDLNLPRGLSVNSGKKLSQIEAH
ncbi:MAG: GxxExxY protein [Verrucomicrobia bacterium]|nr:GxxExxY protein [Verrucomicrobiota bacterium]MCH8511504.1 GxxExxY protein [Kiritimatiellia bacterium]